VVNAADVLDGLLLPSDVERRPFGVRSTGQHNGTASEHQDARWDLETGHLLPQRTGILPAHHHLLQQTVSYQHHRRHFILATVYIPLVVLAFWTLCRYARLKWTQLINSVTCPCDAHGQVTEFISCAYVKRAYLNRVPKSYHSAFLNNSA